MKIHLDHNATQQRKLVGTKSNKFKFFIEVHHLQSHKPQLAVKREKIQTFSTDYSKQQTAHSLQQQPYINSLLFYYLHFSFML